MIEAAIVVGDLLRPDGRNNPGGADRTTRWLWSAVRRQVHLACGLPVEVLTAGDSPGLRGWIESLRPAAAADAHWASVHAGLPWSAPLEQLVIERLRRRFCIGYELPPWLVRLLDAHALPYVDLRLHPVRFMDDLMFAVRASAPETQAALLGMAVIESEVIATAGLREAMCRFISDAAVPDDTLLVIGQQRLDATQIVDGEFFDARPREAEIHALCAGHAAVILKPHPHDPRHSLLEIAAASPGRVLGVITDNIYRMMALPQIAAVLTVSSSVGYEAPYFDKRVHALLPPRLRLGWRGDGVDALAHASLDDVVLAPDFWRLVLAPHAPVSPPDGMRLPAKPNRLRIAFDSFWNFHEIDTDRIPRRAGAI